MANYDVHARKTTEALLLDRAITDPAFRAELLADPKAVFARELGLDVPDTVMVQVLQETPNTVYLVLPRVMATTENELSDAELESVSGGWTDVGSQCTNTCDNTCNPCGH